MYSGYVRKYIFSESESLEQGSRGMVESPSLFRCCPEGHSLVGTIGDRWTVGLGDLRVLFQSL